MRNQEAGRTILVRPETDMNLQITERPGSDEGIDTGLPNVAFDFPGIRQFQNLGFRQNHTPTSLALRLENWRIPLD
jgi:hypothetical protein